MANAHYSQGAALADVVAERAEEIQALPRERLDTVVVAEALVDPRRAEQRVCVQPRFGAVAQQQGRVVPASELGIADPLGSLSQPKRKIGVLVLRAPSRPRREGCSTRPGQERCRSSHAVTNVGISSRYSA